MYFLKFPILFKIPGKITREMRVGVGNHGWDFILSSKLPFYRSDFWFGGIFFLSFFYFLLFFSFFFPLSWLIPAPAGQTTAGESRTFEYEERNYCAFFSCRFRNISSFFNLRDVSVLGRRRKHVMPELHLCCSCKHGWRFYRILPSSQPTTLRSCKCK